MHAFASLLRCYAGINLFQGYRILYFPSYLKFLIPRRNMICQSISAENSTASDNVENKSQENGDTNRRVVISIQNSPEISANDSQTQVIPGGGSTSTEYARSPPSKMDEPQSNSTEDSKYDSIAFEEFFHVSTGNSSFRGSCPSLAAHCGWVWNTLDSPYSIPFWLLLMSAPVSAAVIGALHMHSCPGAANLAIMIFSIGVSYSAALIIKICFILLKILDEEENWRPFLKNFFGVTAVITIGLCVTESAYFWQMESSHEPESSKYCDPEFITYAFWWNCFMWFGIVILFFCQG